MPNQSGTNFQIAYKAETTFGVRPADGGAKVFPHNDGAKQTMSKATIRSNAKRRDGQTRIGRHGSRSVGGSYAMDAALGAVDDLIEAVLRGTWAPALVITEATAGLTSITTTANTIVAAAGSWITAGIRRGDVIRLTNHATPANNDRNLTVVGVTALVITVAETLTANAAADATFTVTRPRKLIQPQVPVNRSFTFEEQLLDLDASEIFTGERIGSLQVQMGPDGMVTLTFGIVGQDMAVLEGAQSPHFTNPTTPISIGLVAVDAAIMRGTTRVATLTSLNFTFDIGASGKAVIGGTVTPEVFTNPATLSGSVTGLRTDMEQVKAFLNEQTTSIHLLLVEPESEPKDFISFFIPLVKYMGAEKDGVGSTDGMTETTPFEGGAMESGAAEDLTMLKIQTSAA